MNNQDDWQEPDGTLGEYLRHLRTTDPEGARRLEQRIANAHQNANEAAAASVGLRAARVAMALDIRRDLSAAEHIRHSVEDSGEAGVCLRFLALASDAEQADLSDPDGFLFLLAMRSGDWFAHHDDQLLRLGRAAMMSDMAADQRP